MRHWVFISVFMLTLFWCSGEASAQKAELHGNAEVVAGAQGSQRHVYRLYYRWDEVKIDRAYLDNERNIEEIIGSLRKSMKIDSITIYAYASPEGVYEHNAMLARKRASAARDFIISNVPEGKDFSKEKIITKPVAENWGGLREAARRNYRRWDRKRVLSILDDATISDATREWRLRQLDGGISWKWMRIHLMPELRVATWICVWESPGSEETEEPGEDEPAPEQRHAAALTQVKGPEDRPHTAPGSLAFTPELHSRTRRRTIAAVKTNLLYDAVTALNFAVEIPFGKRFSVQYEHLCPWWNGGDSGNKYCLQLLSMGGEARWWFLPRTREWYDPQVLSGGLRQRDALMGHYLGLYGDGGKFDIQIGRKFGCYQTHFWGAGLSYGYSMPVGKWANMEFSLSVGYMCIDYQRYTPAPDWSVLIEDAEGRGRMHWFGPTKAKVSLVVPITVKTGRKSR